MPHAFAKTRKTFTTASGKSGQFYSLPALAKTFPNVSRTGRWKDVAHYTQMIWKGTTNVGCAMHVAAGRTYLICRYSPPGNADGRAVP